MKKMQLLGLLSTFILSSQVFAKLPSKSDVLYQKIAKNCQEIQLDSLAKEHQEFLKEQQFKVAKIQACNNRNYLVYLGTTRYDLSHANNVSFAKKFFNDFAKLNQKTKFAVVDTLSKKIFYVNADRKTFKTTYTVENY